MKDCGIFRHTFVQRKCVDCGSVQPKIPARVRGRRNHNGKVRDKVGAWRKALKSS